MILAVKRDQTHVSRTLFLCLILFIVAGCELPSPQPEQIALSGPTMGTSYTVKLIPESKTFTPDKLHKKIKYRLDRVNRLMSTYDPDSELSRFNRLSTEEWFPISKETLEVLEASISISKKTNGAFDFTVAALVDLWGFGKNSRTSLIPDEKTIHTLLEKTGYQKIRVKREPPAIRKLANTIELDLSAIAKGFAVDELAALLVGEGINNFLIEVGGELKSRGTKQNNHPWLVAIENPKDNERSIGKIISLQNQGLATSGDYRNFFIISGNRFSHTISPLTGKPVTHNLASVSVIHPSTMEADGWATALMVMGPEKGFKLAKQEGLAALFTVRTETGFSDIMTDRFRNYIAP